MKKPKSKVSSEKLEEIIMQINKEAIKYVNQGSNSSIIGSHRRSLDEIGANEVEKGLELVGKMKIVEVIRENLP